MDPKVKIKEKLLEHSVAAVLALMGALLSIIWLAVPSEVWGRASEAVPKRVLWALIALELIVIGLLTALAIDGKRKRKNTLAQRFGVMWDEDANPRCPACQTLMNLYSSVAEGHPHDRIQCPKCQDTYALKEDDGTRLRLSAAKEMVAQGNCRPNKK